MFRQILTMPSTRIPHQLLLYHLQHCTGEDDSIPHTEQHVPPHPSRLPHLGADDPVDKYSNTLANSFTAGAATTSRASNTIQCL